MLQVATFTLPDQQAEANEFLKTHSPEGQVHFNKDMIVVFHDDGEYSVQDELADLMVIKKGNRGAKLQQQIAFEVVKHDLANINPVKNDAKYQETLNAKRQIEEAMDLQDLKMSFIDERIATLKGNGQG